MLRAAVSVALAAAVLSGCGSGKRSFADRADALCRVDAKTVSGFGTPTSASDLKAQQLASEGAAATLATGLGALSPPAAQSAAFAQLVRSVRSEADTQIAAHAGVGTDKGVGALRAAQRLPGIQAQSRALAQQLGLKGCAAR